MRILVHDFGAYPFSIQVSRELARRGHNVRYVYLDESGSVRGNVRMQPSDPASFLSVGLVDVDSRRRSSFARRLIHDARYSQQVSDEVRSFSPDIVLSADSPIISQWAIQQACKEVGASFSFWLQDLFGEALEAIVARRSPVIAKVLAAPIKAFEHHLLCESNNVLAIAPAFVDYVTSIGVGETSAHLLPNWAPLTAMPTDDKRWGDDLGLPDGQRVLYSGTLGLKHNPLVLADLARGLKASDGHVVVISEGEGRRVLESVKADQQLDNLFLLDFQPSSDLDRVFASADVLVAILNSDASVFSVPSKVLSYMPAGRPIVALMPPENFAAQRLQKSGGGVVVDPEQAEFVATVKDILMDPQARRDMGVNARRFAETEFAITTITDRIETMCGVIDITEEIDLTPADPGSNRSLTVDHFPAQAKEAS